MVHKKQLQVEQNKQRTKEEQTNQSEKRNKSSQASLQKQLAALQRRDAQYKVSS